MPYERVGAYFKERAAMPISVWQQIYGKIALIEVLYEELSNPIKQQSNTPASFTLSGNKIDGIRILDVLCQLNFFKSLDGKKLHKKIVMEEFGRFLGIDLSQYSSNLSKGLLESDETPNVKIFEEMLKTMKATIDKTIDKKAHTSKLKK
jgi:hypothetical protein